MASGSSKGFDFASDDILCSYEDYSNQEQQSNGTRSDSTKEFNKSRMARASVLPTSSYSPPDDDSTNQEVMIMAVERSMKKHTDNVMRFLEGLSSRLSQLELYCYNLDKSIGEMRTDLARDHGESEAKLKFLEKHVQEVHRSVQILRDKQELADTQKELAKLQLAARKDSSSSQQSEETPDAKKKESQQLAIVPAPQPQRAPEPATQPQPQPQPQAYYLPPAPTQYPPQPQSQLPPAQPQPQPQPAPTQYPQAPAQPPQPPQPQIHSLPQQYQQQWAPQPQPGMQPGSRPGSPQVYHPQYLMTQSPVTPSPPEPVPNSMPMQMPYAAMPPPGPGSSQPMTYSYGGPGPVRTQPPPQQPPPPPAQQMKPGFGGQPGDGYGQPNAAYLMYDNESGRVQHPSQGGQFYPPSQQHSSSGGSGGGGGGMMSRPPTQQFMHNHHPYNELIDKLVSMGYRGDHVMSVIQRLDESGQTVDFNAVLDKLNGHPSQRGWSG